MSSERLSLARLRSAPSPGTAEWDDWPLLYETLARFEEREILPADVFRDLADELKGTAGRLAKVYNTRFTAEIYEELFNALRTGKTVREFATDAQKILDKYGAAEGLQVYTGDHFSPSYADTVFRTNTQAAQAAGRYSEMFAPEWDEIEPYWQYIAIDDARTRPEHAALHGKVFRKDDAAARRYLPPLGFNCRCVAVPLTEDDLKRMGLAVSSGADIQNIPLTDASGKPLLGEDGTPLTVGPPPKGWDADRVESLVPGTLKNSGAGVMSKPGRPGSEPTQIPSFDGPAPPPPTPSPNPIAAATAPIEEELLAIPDREKLVVFRKDGGIGLQRSGVVGEQEVALDPVRDRPVLSGATVIHNHYEKGESFSLFTGDGRGDLDAAIEYDVERMILVGQWKGQRFRYTMQRPANGWPEANKAIMTSGIELESVSAAFADEIESIIGLPPSDRRVLDFLHRFQHELVLAVCGRLEIPYLREVLNG